MAAVVTALMVGAAPQLASGAPEPGPFSALLGSWAGGGLVKKQNGSSERIRCRAVYEPAGVSELQMRLRCASDSYNFDLAANVNYEGGPITGTWSEATRNVNGSVQGRSGANGRQIQVMVQSVAFSANLALTTRGERQSIVMQSPGSEVQEVSITLEKK